MLHASPRRDSAPSGGRSLTLGAARRCHAHRRFDPAASLTAKERNRRTAKMRIADHSTLRRAASLDEQKDHGVRLMAGSIQM
jgi:hypothetical protein